MKRDGLTSVGIICKVDRSGRVGIPAVLRDSMQLNPGSELDMYVYGDKLILRKHYPGCVLCLETGDKMIITYTGKRVCERCVNQISKEGRSL